VLFTQERRPTHSRFQVMEQARRFPDVPFIIGHFGKIMFLDAIRSAEMCPNVYLETSGAQVCDLQMAVERIGYDRILYGTDLPIGGRAIGPLERGKDQVSSAGSGGVGSNSGCNAIRLMDRKHLAFQ